MHYGCCSVQFHCKVRMFEIYLFALNEYMSIIIIEFTMNIE